ncbi:MAG: hypothetical protein WC527_01790 [Candidatus Margulisiibacteriota bacterium]
MMERACLTNLPRYLRSAVSRISAEVNRSSLNPTFMRAMRAEPFDITAALSVARTVDPKDVFQCIRNDAVSVLNVADLVDVMNDKLIESFAYSILRSSPKDASRTARVLELSPKTMGISSVIGTILRGPDCPFQALNVLTMILANENLSLEKKKRLLQFFPHILLRQTEAYCVDNPYPRLFGAVFSVDTYRDVAKKIINGDISIKQASVEFGGIKKPYLTRGFLSFHHDRIQLPPDTCAAILNALPQDEAVDVLVGMRNETLRVLLGFSGMDGAKIDELLRFAT